MTEKQKIKLEKLINTFPNDYKKFFWELTEYAVSLGYYPKLNASETIAEFGKSKHGKTIMRINTNGDSQAPGIRMRFDGLSVCFGIFQGAAEDSNKECMNCNRCDRKKGIKYILPDGSEIIGACQEKRILPSYGIDNINELKEAIKEQDEYLMSLVSS